MGRKRAFSLFLSLLLLMCISTTAFAASTTIDFNNSGTITINLKDKVTLLENPESGSFSLFHVADIVSKSHNISYEYVPDFKNFGTELINLSSKNLGKELATYTVRAEIQPTAIEPVDSNGRVVFSDIEPGVYLITQKESITGYYPVDPFVVSLPITNDIGDKWIYDVEATPKLELLPIETKTVTVTKRWEGDTGTTRPKSVTVGLWNGNTLHSTVLLDDNNFWTYTWEGLEASATWSVKEERIPDHYSATYLQLGDNITITNKYTPPGTPSLIKTGQLNWPIPVFASIGLLFIIIGLALLGKTHKNEET